VATLRDSQNYIRGAELGFGLHEMRPYQVSEDLPQWTSLLQWLAEPSGEQVRLTAAAGLAGVGTTG
jgi:hypothetical protein